MDAAEDDRLGIHACRLAGELERVADEVGHLEELRTLVVVGQDHRVTGALERVDLAHQVGESRAPVGGVGDVAEGGEKRFELGTGRGSKRVHAFSWSS